MRARPPFQHDGVDAAVMTELCKKQARWTPAYDANLRTHADLLARPVNLINWAIKNFLSVKYILRTKRNMLNPGDQQPNHLAVSPMRTRAPRFSILSREAQHPPAQKILVCPCRVTAGRDRSGHPKIGRNRMVMAQLSGPEPGASGAQ